MAEKEKSPKRSMRDFKPSEEVRQHMMTAREEMRESMRTLFPPEFIEHRKAARREILLGLRSFINDALERM
ncbi:MAG: hypothetical protein WBB65_08985 [Anaerolineales bacterium]